MKRIPLHIVVALAAVFAVSGLLSSAQADSDEGAAAENKPLRIERQAFRLSYPADWKIDTEDEDYDPDHLFSVNGPESSFVMFFVYDFASDPKVNVQAQVDAFSDLVLESKDTRFAKWGNLEGEGVHLRGKIHDLPGGIRIFSHTTDTESVTVVAMYFQEDLDIVTPGFVLIENSFELTAN